MNKRATSRNHSDVEWSKVHFLFWLTWAYMVCQTWYNDWIPSGLVEIEILTA